MMVSIVVSLYRTEKHLKRFLHDARVLSADLTAAHITHEIVLVSNDTTAAEREVFKSLTQPFRIFFVPREPIYASWNRGIRIARGKFVTFWGVDDTRFGSAIVEGLKKFETTQADIIYFPFRYYRFIHILGIPILIKIKIFTPPEFDKNRFQKEMHLGPHFMVRKRIFDMIGNFDESFKIAGDFEFQVRAAKQKARFLRTLCLSGIFRNDGSTLSGSRAALHAEENKRIINR